MVTAKISLTLFAAFLICAPSAIAAHWGIGGAIGFAPDDDHYEMLVSAFTRCDEYGARASAYAADHPWGYSASAYTYGQFGPGQQNYYHKGTHTVTASSNYQGEGVKQANANAQSGSTTYWASCTYPGDHGHGGGIVGPDDAIAVACEVSEETGASKFVGSIATDTVGNAFLVGDRDGEQVVLPSIISSNSTALDQVGVLEDTNVSVVANFAPGVCDLELFI